MFWFQKYHNSLSLSLQNVASVLLSFSPGTKVSPRRKWKQCLWCYVYGSILVFLKAALNFSGDSFSQINCFGRCSNVSLIIVSTGLWLIVLILSHVITGLWSE